MGSEKPCSANNYPILSLPSDHHAASAVFLELQLSEYLLRGMHQLTASRPHADLLAARYLLNWMPGLLY
jgi:hypothetical protein